MMVLNRYSRSEIVQRLWENVTDAYSSSSNLSETSGIAAYARNRGIAAARGHFYHRDGLQTILACPSALQKQVDFHAVQSLIVGASWYLLPEVG